MYLKIFLYVWSVVYLCNMHRYGKFVACAQVTRYQRFVSIRCHETVDKRIAFKLVIIILRLMEWWAGHPMRHSTPVKNVLAI